MDRYRITIVPDRARTIRGRVSSMRTARFTLTESPASGRRRPRDRYHTFRRLASSDRYGDGALVRFGSDPAARHR
jgi:hypothetical protein